MKKGFTKAWRKELDSDIWAMPPLYHRVWFWIRQKVQHELYFFPTPKFGIWVLPGQRITSYQQIAEGVKWYEWGKEVIPNKKTIKDIINSLELWGMIETVSNAQGTLISVINWDTYNNVTTEESNAQVTPTGHKKRIKKNEKEVKEEETIEIPDWIDAQTFFDFIASRKTMKAPLTAIAAKRIIKSLEKYRDELGHDPNEVLDQSIGQGWKGVFPLKENRNKSFRSLEREQRMRDNAEWARG